MLLHEIDGPEPISSTVVTQGIPPEEPLKTKIGFELKKKNVYYKIILERGEGFDKPGEDDEVTIRIADVTESLKDLSDPQMYTKKDFAPAVFRGIRDLKRGELSQIHIPKSMNSGVSKIYRVRMIDWVSVTILASGSIKRIKKYGKDVSVDRRDECKIDINITQSGNLIYRAQDFYNRVEESELGPGVVEILKAMKKYEVSVTQVKIEVFKKMFYQYVQDNMNDEDVHIEIEIKKFLKYHDVSSDCVFFKCELEDGTGDRTLPNNNSRVKVWYRYIIEGDIVATNWDSDPVEFYMDEDEVPTLWTNCARQSKVGDLFKVECNLTSPKVSEMSDGLLPQYHFAQYARPGVNYAYFYIKNLSFVVGRPNNLLTLEERLAESQRVKSAGDKFFKIEKYEKAYDKYKAATNFVEPLKDDEDNFTNQIIILYRNMSLCNLKAKKFVEAAEDATKVLEVSPGDTKALYRRALAKRETRNYPQAIEDLKKIMEITSIKGDQETYKIANSELIEVSVLQKEFLEREKKLFLGIFK